MRSVRRPREANSAARFTATVVLPVRAATFAMLIIAFIRVVEDSLVFEDSTCQQGGCAVDVRARGLEDGEDRAIKVHQRHVAASVDGDAILLISPSTRPAENLLGCRFSPLNT